MKICIIRHRYYPEDSRNRKEALALVEQGHSVDTICLRKRGQFGTLSSKGSILNSEEENEL